MDFDRVFMGLLDPRTYEKNNQTVEFEGGYFSYLPAEKSYDFGIDEIALVTNGDFYILNVGADIFEQCKEKVKEPFKEIIKWWIELADIYEIGATSGNFYKLQTLI